eukprot:RCo038541
MSTAMQHALVRVKKAETRQTPKLFEVQLSDDRLDRWEVRFFYYDEEAERTKFESVVLLFQFCKDDYQVPPKVSVLRPRIAGIGLFGGALCFDRQKMWAEYGSDMEAFLLAMRLHLVYQVQARLEEPLPSPTAAAPERLGAGSPFSSGSTSTTITMNTVTMDPMDSSFSVQERANGFNHIMRTHWDWKLVDIADDGTAVVLPQEEQSRLNKQEACRLLSNAMGHFSCRRLSFALQALTEAIQLCKQKSELYYRRAVVFKHMNALSLAEKDLHAAMRRKPVFQNTRALLQEVKEISQAFKATKPRTLYVCTGCRRPAGARRD